MDAIFEFHLSRRVRQTYQFDETLFSSDGRLIFSDFSAARRFVERIYAVSGRLVPASDIYAMGLIDEILHLLIRQYEKQNPGVMTRALEYLRAGLGRRLEDTLLQFTDEFPPMLVYRGQLSIQEYLSGSSSGIAHRQVSMEEMLLVNIANQNPAIEPYKEFFDDSVLQGTAYLDSIRLLESFLKRQSVFGIRESGKGETLFEMLIGPSKASPYSLEGQLQYLLDKWGEILGKDIIQRIVRAMDFVREEVIRHTGHGGFSESAPLLDFHGEPDYERYSLDRDWMPRLILLAKNSYVWLDQLSKKYQRWIKTLDQIPDEELDLLAARGFTGLWLIGLWERSRASQRMKQRMGQEDAVASAYSLNSYEIATDLGGWESLGNLRKRAWQRGIRLSADMVPNHMGIDSAWVIEHPDRFLSLNDSPYPSYTFNSEDLSDDSRAGIILEDHYYSHSDASVVFKRFDHASGETRYIYHGNDGTSFPWNDTAQLDYTRPDVREAVIQTILHVARNFPIIRFDAAMTLTKKHIQRLWFPEPGSGGAIPSRAEHGLTRSEFDAKIPNEFWREVVDRVAAEIPDTLLLAEAFWLMEGYFVRTLGMHRVYNSAFMHMLRDEDNAKYRLAIKNTLEFDPQILKRYVNFMTNPDEKSAVEQFGNGDKYFGVCTLLSTLPGLPMFGHGQVEGFREKYGMEFRHAKWEETADEGLIRGHEWKIFPLLHRRYLFANVEQFQLYDFFTASGSVDENVFAYSNCLLEPHEKAGERGLIIYHNKFTDTRGWIKTSAAAIEKDSGRLTQKSLFEGLRLPRDGYAIFKDYVTHLEYIRSCRELLEKGLYLELGAYQCHALLEWRFVEGDDWKVVNNALNGAGVESVQAKRDELFVLYKEEKVEEEDKKEGTVKGVSKEKARAEKKKGAAGKKSKPAAKKPQKVVKKVAVKVPTKIIKKSATKKSGKNKVTNKTTNSAKAVPRKPAKRKKVPLSKKS
jgi:glycosidase